MRQDEIGWERTLEWEAAGLGTLTLTITIQKRNPSFCWCFCPAERWAGGIAPICASRKGERPSIDSNSQRGEDEQAEREAEAHSTVSVPLWDENVFICIQTAAARRLHLGNSVWSKKLNIDGIDQWKASVMTAIYSQGCLWHDSGCHPTPPLILSHSHVFMLFSFTFTST